MRRRAILLLPLIWWCGCKPAEETTRMKAIIGAVLIDGMGGPPVGSSVVVVGGGRIREAGPLSTVVIPADADKIDGSGKYVIPALVDVFAHEDETASFRSGHPPTAEAAREQVAKLAAAKAGVIHVWKLEPAIAQAALEAAREAGMGAIGHIATEAEVRFLMDRGASGFVGMIGDTESVDPELVGKLRDLRIFFAPALATAGGQAAVLRQNTKRLFAAGVPMAVASNGGAVQAEIEQLAEAGIPPLDAIVAATRNGAAMLRRGDGMGTIQAGKPADLLVVSANPGADVRNLTKVALRMVGGEWVK